MSQMPRRGLPHAFSPSIKALSACAMLLTLTGCTELARFIGKADPKPEEPVVAEQPAPAPAEERVEGPVEKPKPSKLYEWNGDGRKVSHIVIDTDKQRASFFVGEDEIGWSTVASGLPKHPTPTGKFAVMEKVENKRSNLYGKVVKNGKVVRSNAKSGRDPIPAGARFEGAHMPYFMRLTYDGIGLHAGPIPRPGQPASHGCIRLPSTLAPVLFKHVSHGTQVTIVGSGPSYGNYVEKQRVAAARAKREAEQRRIAQANAAQAAATSAEVTPAAASTAPATAVPRADSRPTQQAAATPAAARSPAYDAGAPTAGSTGAVPASAPETSTATAEARDPSPATGPAAPETQPATSVTTTPATPAPVAPAASPERAPQTVAEPVAAPDQTQPETSPATPPETQATTTAETSRPAEVAAPPAQSSPPTAAPTPVAAPAAPAAAEQSNPAPAAEAPQSPPSSGSAAAPAPAPAAPPAAPAAPPAQAQQAPDAAAPGSDG